MLYGNGKPGNRTPIIVIMPTLTLSLVRNIQAPIKSLSASHCCDSTTSRAESESSQPQQRQNLAVLLTDINRSFTYEVLQEKKEAKATRNNRQNRPEFLTLLNSLSLDGGGVSKWKTQMESVGFEPTACWLWASFSSNWDNFPSSRHFIISRFLGGNAMTNNAAYAWI